MPVIGTFGSFTAARMGIYASQASLNVTGNNIANINTDGYTRQRMDLIALNTQGSARYANKMNQDIGYGVLTNGVSQLRDPFLDIRYRDEQANVGAAETWLDCLNQLSHTLDEVGLGDDFGVIEKQFSDFKFQLQQLNGAVGTTEYDSTARASAQVLCNLFNSYAKALEKVENTQMQNIKADITTVNATLTQIRDLNVQIREAGIYGGKALELRDERNVLIDQLSKYMKIDVSYDLEKLDEFNSVERLNISIADSGNPPIRLICGTYGAQIGMPERGPMRNPAYNFDDLNDPGNIGKQKYIASIDDSKTPPVYTYTNNPVTQEQADAEAKEKNRPTPVKADPDHPFALAVNNAVEGVDDDFNRLWMNVQPLVDSRGRVFREADGHRSEMVELGENVLYGSLQSKREFLLGEGEFSSEWEIKYDKDATTTRGVPYYRQALDALAKKFADEFNRANTDTKIVETTTETTEMVKNGTDGNYATYVDKVNGQDVEKYMLGTGCDLRTGFGDARSLLSRMESEWNAALAKNGSYASAPSFDKDSAISYLQQVDLTKLIDGGWELHREAVTETRTGTDGKPYTVTIEEEWNFTGFSDDLMEDIRDIQHYHAEKGCGKSFPVTVTVTVTTPTVEQVGGPLFSSNGDTDTPDGITAANITISKSWSTGETRILPTKKPDPEDHTTADDNIAHMINLMSDKLDYFAKDSVDDAAGTKRYFNGSFQERFADMNVILGVDQETTTTLYNSYSIKSLNLDNDRQSVSGVDLNDEAMNMMVFQKSYAAACQLMTTLDSMLDKLINGTLR